MKTVEFEEHKLSKLSFGTVQLGLDYGISNSRGKPTQESANEIINYLIQNDINSFDTAVAYGNSEEVLGQALKKQEKVNIVSKVKSDLFMGDLEKIVHESLVRLSTNKLFALLLHDSELLSAWNDKHQAKVTLLQEQGLINYFGVSIYTSEEFDRAIKNPDIKVIQIPFNLFDQRAINDKWFKKAEKANKLIFIRSLFLQGLFFMKTDQLTGNLIESVPYLEEVHTLCNKLNLSIAEFAMAYVDSVTSSSVILFGCDTLDQAKENVQSYNNLPVIEQNILDFINVKFSDIPEYIVNPGQWSL
ncbi:aldo/keto reductase [Sulfurovum sp.]|uniref:aldo/keto reductase n=1 Tax=Sulfurovum sp. TaxID=1969726 RepID=UPI003564FE00